MLQKKINIDQEKYADRLAKLFLKRQQEMKELLTSNQYILWLEEFTRKVQGFSDLNWLYSNEDISETDLMNVKKLDIFFECVDSYARGNFIYPKMDDLDCGYSIKYNNIGYQLGLIIGQGDMYYVKRVTIENEDDFIDFNDILNQKDQPRKDIVYERLQELKVFVERLVQDDIPSEAIRDTIGKVLNKKLENK